MMLDIRISGGMIVDGSGRPPYRGDVGIRDDRIVALGKVTSRPAGNRCHRKNRGSRLCRHPHPLRRPGLLGSDPQPVLLPRRDHDLWRQLRFQHRAASKSIRRHT